MSLVRSILPVLAGALLCAFQVGAQEATGTITGRVVDGTSERPLAGAMVQIEGTQRGTVTRADGSYLLPGVPVGAHRVRATQIGYRTESQDVTVAAGASATAEFRLQAQAVVLDELVAVGYGQQRRSDLTGAVGSVSVQDAPAALSSSVGQIMQGRVAGAQVVQNNGAPGGGLSIRIRGTNSITANSEPLYVIDGVPAYVGSSSQDPYRNPLTAISPQDIESIEILKDASATAIYGARGANGVVLVTTRQGRRGENLVRYEGTYGIQSAGRRIPMLNGEQFARLVNEARVNVGRAPEYTDAQISAIGAGTDWQDAVLQRAPMQSHTVSVSGGDDQTRYMVSGGFFDQEGIVMGSEFRRYSGRINLDRTVSDRLQVGTNLSVSNTGSAFVGSDNTLGSSTVMGALWFNPVSPIRDPETGAYIMNSPVTWPVANPVGSVDGIVSQRFINTAIGNVFGELQLVEGLRLRSSLGVTGTFERNRWFAPRTTPQGQGANGTGEQRSSDAIELVNENILTYVSGFGPGNLDLTGGFTVQTSQWEEVWTSNQQFANDATGPWGLGQGTRPNGSSGFSEWALLSYLARANYNLFDRYLFTVTGRYDGSSRFGANTKWGFFPSAAFAWRLIEEDFMQGQNIFSDLKLRLSYGVTGNQEIGLYQSLARLAQNNYAFGGGNVVGFSPAGAAPNPDLKWESTRQFNAGLDLGWWNNRVTATVDAYHSVTDDLLLSVSLPSTSGFTSQLRNIGSVQNRGVELALSSVNVERRNFSWRSTLSWTANRNEVIDIGDASELTGPDKGIGGQTGGTTVVIREGLPLGNFLGYRTEGIYQEGDACPLTHLRANLDCVPGEYRYVDTNGDGRITAADRVVLGNGHPDFFGGLLNSFNYGPLDLNVFLQGVYGNQVLNGPAINLRNINTLSNQTADALRRWTPQNTNTDIPRANADRPREIYDVHVEDGSYLRLQNVTLGYTLPDNLVRGMRQTRIYLTGENLHVWTRYTGFDPEANSFGGDSRSRGIDLGAYPRARTWNIGVNVLF